MGGRVRAGAGDDRRAVADGVDDGGVELELLLVGERRRLARRPGDDQPVRAVVDEELGQLAELVEVDRAVGMERRHARGEDLAEHDFRNAITINPDYSFAHQNLARLLKKKGDARGALQEFAQVFEQQGLGFLNTDRGGGVAREHAGHALAESGGAHKLDHMVGDVHELDRLMGLEHQPPEP